MTAKMYTCSLIATSAIIEELQLLEQAGSPELPSSLGVLKERRHLTLPSDMLKS